MLMTCAVAVALFVARARASVTTVYWVPWP